MKQWSQRNQEVCYNCINVGARAETSMRRRNPWDTFEGHCLVYQPANSVLERDLINFKMAPRNHDFCLTFLTIRSRVLCVEMEAE